MSKFAAIFAVSIAVFVVIYARDISRKKRLDCSEDRAGPNGEPSPCRNQTVFAVDGNTDTHYCCPAKGFGPRGRLQNNQGVETFECHCISTDDARRARCARYPRLSSCQNNN